MTILGEIRRYATLLADHQDRVAARCFRAAEVLRNDTTPEVYVTSVNDEPVEAAPIWRASNNADPVVGLAERVETRARICRAFATYDDERIRMQVSEFVSVVRRRISMDARYAGAEISAAPFLSDPPLLSEQDLTSRSRGLLRCIARLGERLDGDLDVWWVWLAEPFEKVDDLPWWESAVYRAGVRHLGVVSSRDLEKLEVINDAGDAALIPLPLIARRELVPLDV